MTPDQRLDLLLAEAEQQNLDKEAAAAKARVFGTDHSGQQEHNTFTQCHPNGSASANVFTQCNPNGSASSFTQCNPNGSASSSSALQVYGQHVVMPPQQVGGATTSGNHMFADGAFAEQMTAGWDGDDFERGSQPEDEPIDAGHPAERFCLATPQGSVPSIPMLAMPPERACPGHSRRDSPRTPLGKSSRKMASRAQKRAERRAMRNDDSSWIQAPPHGNVNSWTPQKQSLAREIHELRLMNKDQSRELAQALERSQHLEVSLDASNRAHSDFHSLAEKSRAELDSAEMQRELGAAGEEGSTLKQQLARATAEISYLKLESAQGSQRLHHSEQLSVEMAKSLEDKHVPLASASEESTRLQAVRQEGRAYASNLVGQRGEHSGVHASRKGVHPQNVTPNLPGRVGTLVSIKDKGNCRG